MQDKDPCQLNLGPSSPWTVADVPLDHKAQKIHASIEHSEQMTVAIHAIERIKLIMKTKLVDMSPLCSFQPNQVRPTWTEKATNS